MAQPLFQHARSFLETRLASLGATAQTPAQPATATQTSGNGVWPRAPLARRLLADVIDRLVPLPFIVAGYFWPEWILVVFAWHWLRDAGPQRRSFGKLICRLRVVQDGSRARCAWWQAAMRRMGMALAQAAYCLPGWMLWAFVYDLVALSFVLLTPSGQRPEDFAAGTMVVTEAAYRKR
ncbi:MAG: RDD family protein [Acidobacteria bacterium]|nr:RDD family protein [Acidobacteriota bacterium]